MTIPALRDLLEQLGRQPAFQEILTPLRRSQAADLELGGLQPVAQILYCVLLHKLTERPVALLVESNAAAENAVEAAAAFAELAELTRRSSPTGVLPAHDVTPYDGLSPHAEIAEQRGVQLWRMADGQASVVIAPIGAALMKTAPREFFRNLAWKVESGDEFFLEDLEEGLLSVAYTRREPVEMVGQFSIRGGIVDVFPPEAPAPLRIEMFGDQVESIRRFDPETQKSIERVDQALILPLSDYSLAEFRREPEQAADGDYSALGPGAEFAPFVVAGRTHCVLDLLERPIAVWSEPAALQAEAEKLWERLEEAHRGTGSAALPPQRYYFRYEDLRRRAASHSQVRMERLSLGEDGPRIDTQPTPHFEGNIAHCMREIQAQISAGSRALVCGATLGDVERLSDIFREYGVPYQLGLRDPAKVSSPYLQEHAYFAGPVEGAILVQAAIREGVAFPGPRILIYGAEDIFSSSELVAKPEKRRSAASTFLSDLQDLQEGDLVVHSEHGVGRFLGLRQIRQGERQEDFMLLEYADQARLYLPLSRLDLVQKYHGAGGKAPALDRMGGQTWQRTKSRVKARLKDMAGELLKLYALRHTAEGFAYSPDGAWQREFEDAFEYPLTPDQESATNDVKRDMEQARPMDRLICGDVGFGKTEVAMRAAFKALADGKQVAVLAPTTVLAFQHFETFKQRFAAFPVEIEMLTRFRSPKEQKAIVERLAAGKVDIVIGTHRLLSQDVEFQDLGLLIIDEEQRFGVRHKERFKQMRRNVDVMTLTATPIPRTLHMSLVGLRDISIIQTPPKDRLAIHTVVAPFSDQLIRNAIEREIARGGQVYFIHNRVESIWPMAARIQEMFPKLRIGVGHGQMAEKDLETVVLKFMRHEYDVLVATTIVENGLDIPLANTMIVNRADLYGLSELYQLRGRVGRSNRRAYAYLLIPEDRELTAVARKRLAALKEFSELGSGFKIAALDLELRGAGNLLGGEQSGQIAAVGFETYCRLLEDEIRKHKGEEVEEAVRTSLRLQLDVHIPTSYIAEESQRLRAYKRIAEAGDDDAREQIAAELADRYGPPPQAVRNLVDYSAIKSQAERLRIAAIERQANRLKVRFREDSRVDPRRLMEFVANTKGARFSPSGELEWPLVDGSAPKLMASVKGLLDRLQAA